MRCVYCDVPNYKRSELSTREVLDGVAKLKRLGMARIHFGGGEPLLREDIADIINFCHENQIYTAILTNGQLFNHNINVLKKTNLVKMSFDGPETIHDSLRGAGSYKKVISAAEAAVSHKINLAFSSTLSSKNMGHIDNIVKTCLALKVPVKFQLLTPFLSGKKDVSDLVIPDKEKKYLLDKIILYKKKSPYIINSLPALKYMRDFPDVAPLKCASGKLILRISDSGKIYLCNIKRNLDTNNTINEYNGHMIEWQDSNDCKRCLCTTTLELNHIFSLNISSILNALKIF
jgi:MoaA/NifB/PqqE/SkfB family radical SAM enzyme